MNPLYRRFVNQKAREAPLMFVNALILRRGLLDKFCRASLKAPKHAIMLVMAATAFEVVKGVGVC